MQDGNGNPVDTIQFMQNSLGFSALGSNFGTYAGGGDLDPTNYSIIAVKHSYATSWNQAPGLIDDAIDVSLDTGNNAGTYFILSNGTAAEAEARVYYWQGNTYDDAYDTVEAQELHHIATLEGIGQHDLANLTDDNFEIDNSFEGYV
ncbi:MAG: hypothetical protein GY860_11540 [Desulfobacteraceae bacterium]|nr:hypothetical protein [Desulfobacteraceae bacterium]